MKNCNTYRSSDYIGGGIENVGYYYGYEVSRCTECKQLTPSGSEYCDKCEDANRDWCFEVKIGKESVFVKTWKELEAEDMFDLGDCLVRGMMVYIESLRQGEKNEH